jgi:hypothetical protein
MVNLAKTNIKIISLKLEAGEGFEKGETINAKKIRGKRGKRELRR